MMTVQWHPGDATPCDTFDEAEQMKIILDDPMTALRMTVIRNRFILSVSFAEGLSKR